MYMIFGTKSDVRSKATGYLSGASARAVPRVGIRTIRKKNGTEMELVVFSCAESSQETRVFLLPHSLHGMLVSFKH